MSAYPIAHSAAEAADAAGPLERTEHAAAERAGGPVYLAAEPLDEPFATIAAAEVAWPQLYGDGRFELAFIEGAWRVIVRFWRPAPPAPAARSPAAAVKRPLAHARTPDEARTALGGPAELASDALPRLFRTPGLARAAAPALAAQGLAKVEPRGDRFALIVTYWRPVPSAPQPKLAPVERDELAFRAAQPLKGPKPQLPLNIGLFERLAPENPAIILAEEEGVGRKGEA